MISRLRWTVTLVALALMLLATASLTTITYQGMDRQLDKSLDIKGRLLADILTAKNARLEGFPEITASAAFQHSKVSVASAGRNTSRLGMARRAARCSTGWWVGPSSPRPMESWVQT